MKRVRFVISVLGVAAMSASALSASALPRKAFSPRTPVVAGRADEFFPAADDAYVSWTANTRQRPRHFDVYFSVSGGPKQRVNPPGTQATGGGIDGAELIYSQTSDGSNGNLVLYDMATDTFLPIPPGVNTGREEFNPTNSGDYLLFERDRFTRRNIVERIVLHNTLTDAEIILAEIDTGARTLVAGQVNGNWATYFVCSRRVCNVYRYDILGADTTRVPNPQGLQQYASSVSDAGVVYFVRSGVRCGQNVRYMSWDGLSDPVLFRDFPDRVDSFDSYFDDAGSALYFERIRCRDFSSDIHKQSIP